MKLQFKILLSIIRKNIFWIIVLIILQILSIILIVVRPAQIPIIVDDYLGLIGFPEIHSFDNIKLLITIYQTYLMIHIIYTFYIYELEQCTDFILLRIKGRNWFLKKSLIIFLFILVFKILLSLLTYLYFFEYFIFDIKFIIYPSINQFLLSLIIMTIVNFVSNKNLRLVFVILLSVNMLLYFNIVLFVILSILLFLINIKYFRFKHYFSINFS